MEALKSNQFDPGWFNQLTVSGKMAIERENAAARGRVQGVYRVHRGNEERMKEIKVEGDM
jgi:hypothetical protein